MNFKKYILQLLKDFTAILSITLIFTSLFLLAFSIKNIDTSLLWQIIFISFVAVLFNLIFYLEGWLDNIPFFIKMLTHFVLVYLLFIFSAYSFHWFKKGETSFIVYFSLFLVIGYLFCFVLIKLNEKKQTDFINKKLNEYKDIRSDKIE